MRAMKLLQLRSTPGETYTSMSQEGQLTSVRHLRGCTTNLSTRKIYNLDSLNGVVFMRFKVSICRMAPKVTPDLHDCLRLASPTDLYDLWHLSKKIQKNKPE